MIVGRPLCQNSDWLTVIAFTWRIMIGALATAGVALCLRSDPNRRESSRESRLRE